MGQEPQHGNPLGLDPETMRELGYRTVDMLVRRLTDASIAPLRRATPADMRARLSGPLPEDGHSFDTIVAQLERDVLPFMSRGDHPGFMAFMPFCGTWPGALGDFIASACNVYAGSWMESAGPTQIELEVLGWFKRWIGYPADAGGVLVSGGSAANLTALACARETLAGAMSDDLVGYVGDQAHSSLARAARVLGFRPDQLRVLPSGAGYQLDPRILAAAMDADLRAARRPLFVSATAGTTNTGAIDPMVELAGLCRERGVWLHVDAAYGGFATLTDRGRRLLAGIELADSVTLDPHKWLYQPYECGCLLVRDDRALRTAFQMTPDYLQDAEVDGEAVNLCDRGLQLTRGSRALKVWISLQYFGARAFAEAIDHALDLALEVRDRVARSDALELMAPPSLGIVCFRRRFSDAASEEQTDARNAALVGALEASGVGFVSSTQLRGRYALRVCVLNHTTRRADVDRVMDVFEHAQPAPADATAVAVNGYQRDQRVQLRPLRRRIPRSGEAGEAGVAAAIAGVPLLAELDDAGRAHAAALARIDVHGAGVTVVEQWDAELDFFVIVAGDVEILIDGESVAELGAGDFFGELAVLDWGGGYGYPRIATVRTLTDTTLLTFPEGSLNELARENPAIARQIRRIGAERLHRP